MFVINSVNKKENMSVSDNQGWKSESPLCEAVVCNFGHETW